jgi:hypothetical protein
MGCQSDSGIIALAALRRKRHDPIILRFTSDDAEIAA